MFQQIFFLLLFILILGSKPGNSTPTGEPQSYRVELFKRKVSTVPFEENNGKVRQRTVHSFRAPSLVEVNGVLVAIADARYDDSNDNSFIETVVKFSVDGGKKWKTQIAVKNSRVGRHSRIVDPTVIVKENKIFLLVGSYNKTNIYWTWQSEGSDWDPLLTVGEVQKTNVNGKISATITWSNPVSLKSIFPKQIVGVPSNQFLGGVGVGITTRSGTLIFPIQATNTNKKITSMLLYSEDNGKTWKFSKGNTCVGCSEPVILEWEDKIVMSNRFDHGYRKVYESTDMGTTWTEALGTISRVWGNSPTRSGPGSQSSFITVNIEGKKVILFTHPLNFKGKWERDRLHLWVTDYNRIYDVGQISIGDENAAYSSLLYINDTLRCLHEINHGEVYSLVLVYLIDELEKIKSVVRNWTIQDAYFSGKCSVKDFLSISSGRSCRPEIPTSGIVGFLSNKGNTTVWNDIYQCVNANVRKGEKVHNGFNFQGSASGALWPVKKQGQNRRYQFTNYAFTLVATVTIHKIPSEDINPLLGASLDETGTRKILGISYTRNQQWRPIYGSELTSPTGLWEINKTYQIVLRMHQNMGVIFINGEPLIDSEQELGYNKDLPDISHIYIAGYDNNNDNNETGKETSVTVTNALLYNRPLNSSEIKLLFLNKNSIGVASEDYVGVASEDYVGVASEDYVFANGKMGKDTSTIHNFKNNLWFIHYLFFLFMVLLIM